MLGYFILKHFSDKMGQEKFRVNEKKMDMKGYVYCTSFLEKKIAYYKEMNYPKGSIESMEWVNNYSHYVHCKTKWQTKIDKMAVELILLTFNQKDIYKLYEYQKKMRFGVGIEKFIFEQRSKLSLQKDLKNREILIANMNANTSPALSEYKLNKAIEKEKEISERNKKERILMESLSEEKLNKVNAEGTPTLNELIGQGIIKSMFSGKDLVNVAVYCKIYGYYYLVASCRERYNVTGSSYKLIPYKNREDAINDLEKYFLEEIKLSNDYKNKQIKKQQAQEKQRNNDVDISNVRRVMGLDDNINTDVDGDIF